MDGDDHRILFRGIESHRVEQPSLGTRPAALPVKVPGLSPEPLRVLIAVRDRSPLSDLARPDLRHAFEGRSNSGRRGSAARDRQVKRFSSEVRKKSWLGEAAIPGVAFLASPPPAGTSQMSPPVEPKSLMSP